MTNKMSQIKNSETSPYLLHYKHWGQGGWVFINCAAFMYPSNPTSEEKEEYKKFFESVGNVLPCPRCKQHYNQNLITHPVNLDQGPRGLTEWLLALRNEINRDHGEKEWKYLEFVHAYMPAEMAENLLNLTIAEKEELKNMDKQQEETSDKKETNSNPYRVAVIVLGILLGIALIVMIWLLWKK